VALEPFPLLVGPVGVLREIDLLGRELRDDHFVEHLVLLPDQQSDALADLIEGLLRGQFVGARRRRADLCELLV